MDTGTIFSEGDLLVGTLYGLAFLVAAVVVFYRSPERGVLWTAALVKLVTSWAMCLVSVYVFSASDSFGYHMHGKRLSALLRDDLVNGTYGYFSQDPFFLMLGNSTTRYINFSGLIHFLALDSYIASSMLLSAIGFIGQVLTYRTFVSAYPDRQSRNWWRFGILFMPTLTFWSSGLYKDPLGIWGVGLALWGAHRFLLHGRMAGVLAMGVGVYTLALFRTQVVPVILVSMLPMIANSGHAARQFRRRLNPLARALIQFLFAVASIGMLYWVSSIDKRTSLVDVGDTLMAERMRYRRVEGGSTILGREEGMESGGSSPVGIALRWPEAVVTTLFRPFIWEGLGSPLMLAAGIENAVLLALTMRALARVALRPWIVGAAMRTELFTSCLIFILVFAFAVGLAAPNLGTISRYRIPVIPFFIGALGILQLNHLGQRRPVGAWEPPSYMPRADLSGPPGVLAGMQPPDPGFHTPRVGGPR